MKKFFLLTFLSFIFSFCFSQKVNSPYQIDSVFIFDNVNPTPEVSAVKMSATFYIKDKVSFLSFKSAKGEVIFQTTEHKETKYSEKVPLVYEIFTVKNVKDGSVGVLIIALSIVDSSLLLIGYGTENSFVEFNIKQEIPSINQ